MKEIFNIQPSISSETHSPSDFFHVFQDIEKFNYGYFFLAIVVFSIVAYLLGSLNAGQIMSKIWKKDLGQEGSGNYGATNAFRAWGSKGFAIVFILDMMKSISAALVIWFLAILIGKIIISDETIIFLELTLAIPFAIVFVMIGHTYPLYFGFKGGKGVACSFGLIIVINWIFALIAISCFGVILKITKKMSAASIFGTLIGGILLLFQPLMYSTQAYVLVPGWSLMWSIWPGVFITVMIVEIKHIPNIKRMIRGEELSIGNENK